MKKTVILLFVIFTLKIFATANYLENIDKIKQIIKENKEFNVKNSIVSKIGNGELEVVYPKIECSSADDEELKKYYGKNIKKAMGYSKWDDKDPVYIMYPLSGYKIFEFKNKEKNEIEKFCYAEEYYDKKIDLKENSLLKSLKNGTELIIRAGENWVNYKEDEYKVGIFKLKNDYYVLIFKDGRTEKGLNLYKYIKNEKEFKLIENYYRDNKIENIIESYLRKGEFFEIDNTKDKVGILFDTDGNGEKEKIEITFAELELELKSLKINGKNMLNDEIGGDSIGILPYKENILFAIGISNNGVDPSYKLYKFKNGKLIKEFEEEFSSIEGIRDGKILTFWNQLFANNSDFENRKYIKYYDINKKIWQINNSLIGKWMYNDCQNLLIYKNLETAYTQDKLLVRADIETVEKKEKRILKDKKSCNGVLKFKEKFKIIKFAERYEGLFEIETEKGVKGYILRGHYVAP